jgi:hypothetical protein
MSDLKRLKNLRQTLSAELQRRPAEERRKFTEEAKREQARLNAWHKAFPWFDVSELEPWQRAEFMKRLKEGFERLEKLKAEGGEAWVTELRNKENVPNPHLMRWLRAKESNGGKRS